MMEHELETSVLPEQLACDAVTRLRDKQLVLSTAESCTGGLVAAAVVSVPGASSVFKEGYITYSDDVKHKLLGVSRQTLEKYTAVSEQTASEMAYGGAMSTGADVCVAVTGVAGPDKEDGKPVGLVYIGCFYQNHTIVKQYTFTGGRQEIRNQAVVAALQMIIRIIS